MKNRMYQKVLKRIVMLVALLVFSLSILSFVQADEYEFELDDYNLFVYDISGDYYESQPDGTISMTVSQDSNGKVRGYGTISLDLWLWLS